MRASNLRDRRQGFGYVEEFHANRRASRFRICPASAEASPAVGESDVRQSWRAWLQEDIPWRRLRADRPPRLMILITFGFSAAHQTGSYLYSYVSIRLPRQSLCACTSMYRFFRTPLPAWSKQRCPTSHTGNARHTVRHRPTPNPASPAHPANRACQNPQLSKTRFVTPVLRFVTAEPLRADNDAQAAANEKCICFTQTHIESSKVILTKVLAV